MVKGDDGNTCIRTIKGTRFLSLSLCVFIIPTYFGLSLMHLQRIIFIELIKKVCFNELQRDVESARWKQ